MVITNQKVYEVTGRLPKGFQGHITYTVLLPENLEKLHVLFAFDKLNALQGLEELQEECCKAVLENLPEGTELPKEVTAVVSKLPKTEINVSLFLDNFCLGSAHQNRMIKEIEIGAENASDGFVNCRLTGVLGVVLHVLNVLNDDTNYTLSLEGGMK